MQCLILAGGLGTRMDAVAEGRPKALIPVRGRPFADHQLTWLAGQGVGRVVYAIGHKGDMIRDFVGDGGRWGLEVAYADEGESPLGTAGAIRLAVDEVHTDAGFLVLYGDSYLSIDLAAVWEASGAGALPLMCVYRNDGQWERSNAVFEDGLVTLFEKGREDAQAIGMNYIDYGLSVLSRDVIAEHVPPGEAADLAQVCRRLAEHRRLHGFEIFDRFYEIGSPEGLRDLEAHLAARSG